MAENDESSQNNKGSVERESQETPPRPVSQKQYPPPIPPQQSRERKAASQEREGGVNSSEDEKQNIVRQLFGDVGELKKDFSCAVESSILLHGRMYVTKKFLCFYSNLFGLEKKIRVPYSHISVISKENTALVIPNAISVTTFRKEYIFRSFWDRDECYNLIKELVEQVKGTRGSTASSHEEANAASIIHKNPPKIDAPSASSSSPTQPAQTKGGNGDEYESEDSKRNSVKVASTTALENPEEAFQLEMDKNNLKLESSPVVIGGTVDEFFNKFVADGAPLSYKKYQSENGDKDVEATAWVESSSFGCTRDMRFLKPVAVPAMPYARALMTQQYKRFGDYALTIASSTRMEDVPYCDFFTVEVLLTVRVTGDNELTLISYNGVKFIQSTMFRRFIEGNTNPDVKRWNEDFASFVKENMPEVKRETRTRRRGSTVKLSTDTVPGPVYDALNSFLEKVGLGPLPPPEVTSERAFYCALGCLMLIFIFFAWQWRGVRVELRNVNKQMRESVDTIGAIRRDTALQKEITDAVYALHRIQDHSKVVVDNELKALTFNGGTTLQYEQIKHGFSHDQFIAWQDSLQDHPLLVEHIQALYELNSVIERLESVLSNESCSVHQ